MIQRWYQLDYYLMIFCDKKSKFGVRVDGSLPLLKMILMSCKMCKKFNDKIAVKNMQPSGFNVQICNNGEISVAVKIYTGADEKQKINK